MTQYISSSPSPPLAEASPLLSLWMLPFTLSQTWLTAWVRSDDSDAERLLDARQGEQIPVPVPLQDSKDGSVFA